jgi:hypothetical protein
MDVGSPGRVGLGTLPSVYRERMAPVRIFDESGNVIKIQARRPAHTLLPLRHILSPLKSIQKTCLDSPFLLLEGQAFDRRTGGSELEFG